MALGLVGCMGHFFGKQLNQCMFLGELSLDGSIRSVRGALSAALAAREFGLKSLVVPEANAREAAVVEGVNVFGLKTLPQAVDLVNAPESFQPVVVDAKQMLSEAAQYTVDLRDVHGQQAAKRALEVACAGGHNKNHKCSIDLGLAAVLPISALFWGHFASVVRRAWAQTQSTSKSRWRRKWKASISLRRCVFV